MSILKVDTINTSDGSGNITFSRPTVLTAGDIVAADIAADAIDGTKLADNACDSEHYTDASIDNAHLADDAVGVAELSATGTASSSTFLRGDNAWAAAGGGDCVFLSSTTASAASSIDITSADGLDSSLYSMYAVYLEGLFCTTTGNDLVLRTSDNNGSSYDTSGYFYAARGLDDAGSSHDSTSGSAGYIRVVGSAGAGSGVYAVWGWVWIPVSVSTTANAGVTWHTSYRDTGNDLAVNVGAGAQNSSPDSGGIDAFQFLPHSSGNLTGTVHIYGYKKT